MRTECSYEVPGASPIWDRDQICAADADHLLDALACREAIFAAIRMRDAVAAKAVMERRLPDISIGPCA